MENLIYPETAIAIKILENIGGDDEQKKCLNWIAEMLRERDADLAEDAASIRRPHINLSCLYNKTEIHELEKCVKYWNADLQDILLPVIRLTPKKQ